MAPFTRNPIGHCGGRNEECAKGARGHTLTPPGPRAEVSAPSRRDDKRTRKGADHAENQEAMPTAQVSSSAEGYP